MVGCGAVWYEREFLKEGILLIETPVWRNLCFSTNSWRKQKMYCYNSSCDILQDICKDCIKEHCAECTANDLENVCETCNLVEELNCIECEVIRDICINCPDVKDCDYRR